MFGCFTADCYARRTNPAVTEATTGRRGESNVVRNKVGKLTFVSPIFLIETDNLIKNFASCEFHLDHTSRWVSLSCASSAAPITPASSPNSLATMLHLCSWGKTYFAY